LTTEAHDDVAAHDAERVAVAGRAHDDHHANDSVHERQRGRWR
jgi:hypothetical protein